MSFDGRAAACPLMRGSAPTASRLQSARVKPS